jgi:hypothetical protein
MSRFFQAKPNKLFLSESELPSMGSMTVDEVKQKFRDGEIEYDDLLDFLFAEHGDDTIPSDLEDDQDYFDHDDVDADELSYDDVDAERSKQPSFDQQDEEIDEVAPPDEEEWVKKNKAEFIKRYGAKKGMAILYATAWKRHKAVKEAWGDDDMDDGLSSAERELIAKSDRELKRGGVKVDKFDPDQVEVKDEKRTKKQQPSNPSKPTQAEKTKPEQKKDGGEEEVGHRGRGKPIGERGGNIRTWLKDNPQATRKEFMAKAVELGMGQSHANTLYYTLKRKIGECFFIGMDGKYLTESCSLIAPKFIDLADSGELLVFESKREAYRMVELLRSSGKAAFVI